MKIHLLTISREKLHNHDFISKINYDKKTFFQEMSMDEEFLKKFERIEKKSLSFQFL